MSEAQRWQERYEKGDTPWDTGRPSSELRRVLQEQGIAPCRAIDLGCGTGVNAVWLAGQGFPMTGVDISSLAIERARARASEAGVTVDFRVADLSQPANWCPEPFAFFFDRGCYHILRRANLAGYLRSLSSLTAPGSLGLILTGNAKAPVVPGPPVVSEEEIRSELGSLFEILQLREFFFDQSETEQVRYLAWSCLVRR